jgi:hypothetical protein
MAPAGAAALACQPMAPTTAMGAVMAAAMMKLRMCFPSLDEWKPKVRILSLRAPSRCDCLAANTASHWTATKRGRFVVAAISSAPERDGSRRSFAVTKISKL